MKYIGKILVISILVSFVVAFLSTTVFAGINVIDKIVPKNDAFTGLVEADQVIGNTISGTFLPQDVYGIVSSTEGIFGSSTINGSSTWTTYLSCNIETDAGGLLICGVDDTGAGSPGTLGTSSAPTVGHFPYYTAYNTLSGTSTITFLLTGINVTGTIYQSGVPVLTTSTGLTVANFLSPNNSQWTNDSSYITGAPATNTIIAGGTATGPAITFATSGPLMQVVCGAGTCTFTTISTSTILQGVSTGTVTFATNTAAEGFNVTSSGNLAFTLTIPSTHSEFYSPTTTIATDNADLANGASYVTQATQLRYATSSIAALWTALQQFNLASTSQFWSSSSSFPGFGNALVVVSSTDKLVPYTPQDCGAGNYIQSLSATGTPTCAADVSGTGSDPYKWLVSGSSLLSTTSVAIVETRGVASSTESKTASGTITNLNFTNATGSVYSIGGEGLLYSSQAGEVDIAIAGINVARFQATNSVFGSNFLPETTQTYILGAGAAQWLSIFSKNVSSTDITASGFINMANSTISTALKIPNTANPTVNAAGKIAIDTTTRRLHIHDGTAEQVLNPEKCFEPAFNIEYPSVGENLPVWIANATSTITKLKSVHKTNGDTVTFNLIWESSRATASSSANHLFLGAGTGGNVTSTATTTLDQFPSLVTFASTTVKTDDIVRITTSAASSTGWTLTVCYREDPI